MDNSEDYNAADKKRRKEITDTVYKEISVVGGKFLEKEQNDSVWIEVLDEKRIRKKISEAFRECNKRKSGAISRETDVRNIMFMITELCTWFYFTDLFHVFFRIAPKTAVGLTKMRLMVYSCWHHASTHQI